MVTGNPGLASGGFGGQWTVDKLEILRRYLNAYTTALKKQPFNLMYIDAFAGTGDVSPRLADEDARAFMDGSAKLAIDIDDKPFDRLVFVEKDIQRYNQLLTLRQGSLGRDIRTVNSDANLFLNNFQEDWKAWRGVLFLDPFGAAVQWATIEKIAGFNALDTWILFPVSIIARLMPISKNPDDISGTWAAKLNQVYGDESWRELYHPNPQQSLFADDLYQRDPGTDGILRIYKYKLKTLFGPRFMEKSRTFVNSNNAPLFEFVFCAGNPSGANIAKKIAGHILDASG